MFVLTTTDDLTERFGVDMIFRGGESLQKSKEDRSIHVTEGDSFNEFL